MSNTGTFGKFRLVGKIFVVRLCKHKNMEETTSTVKCTAVSAASASPAPANRSSRLPLSEEQKQAIASMFAQRVPAKEMARRVGCGIQRLSLELGRSGCTFADRQGCSSFRKVTESHKQAIAAMFDRGDNAYRIHQKTHLSYATVQRVLCVLGKDYRRRGRAPEQVVRIQAPMSDADYRQSPEISEPKTAVFRQTPDTAKTNTNRTNADCGSSAAKAIKVMVSCHAAVLRCGTCQFDSNVLEQFISHLLCSEHKRFNRNANLVCTGCRFQSRQPLKMISHAIKHQTTIPTEGEKKDAD